MLTAIRAARERAFLSTYIFDTGPVGQEFADALGDAVARGVDVRVAIDGVGSLYSWPPAHRLLERRGVRIERFLIDTMLGSAATPITSISAKPTKISRWRVLAT